MFRKLKRWWRKFRDYRYVTIKTVTYDLPFYDNESYSAAIPISMRTKSRLETKQERKERRASKC